MKSSVLEAMHTPEEPRAIANRHVPTESHGSAWMTVIYLLSNLDFRATNIYAL